MIHYILLPTEERHALRREYRLRLAIVMLFFVSCAVALGIVSLLPAYLYSRGQEKEALLRQEALLKSRKESGAEQIEKDLVVSEAIAEKIIANEEKIIYNELVQKIISHRKRDLHITSFALSREMTTTTLAAVTLQGRAGTRESLLDFKKQLEGDKTFLRIELPLSDLAKNKNISFSMRLKARRP